MPDPIDTLDLLEYRRLVSDSYADVRAGEHGASTWSRWRTDRDELFATHPQSPLSPDAQRRFAGLPYFPYDPAWRMTATVTSLRGTAVAVEHSGAGATPFRRFGRVEIETPVGSSSLTLYWLAGYGGGVFLPFRDATSGTSTYGGGRYLLDTVKGADLGHDGEEIVLDFNYAYHPSCAHDARWSCPLAPAENWLEVEVRAGERLIPEPVSVPSDPGT